MLNIITIVVHVFTGVFSSCEGVLLQMFYYIIHFHRSAVFSSREGILLQMLPRFHGRPEVSIDSSVQSESLSGCCYGLIYMCLCNKTICENIKCINLNGIVKIV